MTSPATTVRADIRIERSLLLDPARIGEAARVLAASLIDEPGFVTVYPDRATRRLVMESLIRLPIEDSLAFGTVWIATAGDEVVGAAVWLPAGAFPPTAWRGLRMLPKLLPLLRYGLRAFGKLLTIGSNAQRYVPDEPVWYLQVLGVAPGHQGRGIGTRLIEPALALADARGEPAYLETGEAINVRFYERTGFEVREAAARLAPAPGPTHWTMYRPAPDASG